MSHWIVVETMGTGAQDEVDPSVVFKGGKSSQYTSVDRLRHEVPRGDYTVLAWILKALDTVTTTGKPESAVISHVAIIAEPVFGPNGVVFAVQLWIGDDADSVPPPRRLVGGFEFVYDEELDLAQIHEGPNIERDILGIDGPTQDVTRVAPEVFQYFYDFPRESEIGPFVRDMKAGRLENGAKFDSALTVRHARDSDDQLRYRCYMTMRAVRLPSRWALRGVVHDINDVEPAEYLAFNRHTARVIANLEERESGLGRIDFATGLVTDWLRTPPPPLSAWLTDSPIFHEDEQETIAAAQLALLTRQQERATYRARIRFAGGPTDVWHVAQFTITPDKHGEDGLGFLTVELLSKEAMAS
ncbi:GAF domain-containing protein [Gordonia sp. KTR9]|uniref:GAF domain-containing protein n=1 Tax=Gordonia sp. KTR9 TaxID=337191 RepID=UPI00027DE536|nr:GAF domain-containing protein [Gordonia sp. KTR9]AFR51498.1 hypothetical protein KTR9_5039 [Gordonia sp. KTR9]